jgi:hypothetical protein
MQQFSLSSEARDDQDAHRFLDPISLDIMNDPVRAVDGHTYDRGSIEAWFKTLRTNRKPLRSPLTNLPLSSEALTPNEKIKKDLLRFMSSKSTIQLENIRLTLGSDIHKDIDNLISAELLTTLDLKPPKIIVIGNESHGKSTLLERIIGLPLFPKEKGICTRCVIRVHLRRCAPDAPAIAEISTRQLGRSTATSTVIFAALDNIREQIQLVMNELVRTDQRKRLILDDYEIIVKVPLPYSLNLDIVDIPGLVMTIPTGVTQNLPEVTLNLATKIVQEEKEASIFLLVNDIRVPPNQSRACAIIQQAKVENQTLGVFTKLDIFFSEDGDEIHDVEQLLKGAAKYSFPVGGGWMAAASKKPPAAVLTRRTIVEVQALAMTNKTEDDLFQGKFSRLLPLNALGVDKIREKVRELYEGYIRQHWIPVIANRSRNGTEFSQPTVPPLATLYKYSQHNYDYLVKVLKLSADTVKTVIEKNGCANLLSILTFVQYRHHKKCTSWKNVESRLPNNESDSETKKLISVSTLNLGYPLNDVLDAIVFEKCRTIPEVQRVVERAQSKEEFQKSCDYLIDILSLNASLVKTAIERHQCRNLRALVTMYRCLATGKSCPSMTEMSLPRTDKDMDKEMKSIITESTFELGYAVRDVMDAIAFERCTTVLGIQAAIERRRKKVAFQSSYEFLTNDLNLSANLVKVAMEENNCWNILSVVSFIRHTMKKKQITLAILSPTALNRVSDHEMRECISKTTKEFGYSVDEVLDAVVFDKCRSATDIVTSIERKQMGSERQILFNRSEPTTTFPLFGIARPPTTAGFSNTTGMGFPPTAPWPVPNRTLPLTTIFGVPISGHSNPTVGNTAVPFPSGSNAFGPNTFGAPAFGGLVPSPVPQQHVFTFAKPLVATGTGVTSFKPVQVSSTRLTFGSLVFNKYSFFNVDSRQWIQVHSRSDGVPASYYSHVSVQSCEY